MALSDCEGGPETEGPDLVSLPTVKGLPERPNFLGARGACFRIRDSGPRGGDWSTSGPPAKTMAGVGAARPSGQASSQGMTRTP
jgi:hypothetical protein